MLLLAIALLAATCIATPLPANAASRTIVVPDDYSSITDAISHAVNGDTILVKAGTYHEPSLVIDKPISLIGENPDTTTINDTDPLYSYRGRIITPSSTIRINSDGVRVSGFTLRGGAEGVSGLGNRISIEGNTIIAPRSCINVNGSTLTIAQNILRSQSATMSPTGGWGIFSQGFSNNITANKIFYGGIHLEKTSSYNTVYGNAIEDGAIGVYGDRNVIAGNNVTKSRSYVFVDGSFNSLYANRLTDGAGFSVVGFNSTFYSNYLANNRCAACIGGSASSAMASGTLLWHNNFVNNTIQVYTDYPVYGVNYFDDGREGNFWSDYAGTDANSDGIGDTPYVIDEARRDNFPLMFPWGDWNVSLSYPVNRRYAGGVPLAFVVDRPCSWFGYSVDGQDNVTVSGMTTISGLAGGWHTVTVYANDTLGNSGASEPISFLVMAQPMLSQMLFAAFAIAAVVAVVAGFALYRRKRRRETGKA